MTQHQLQKIDQGGEGVGLAGLPTLLDLKRDVLYSESWLRVSQEL